MRTVTYELTGPNAGVADGLRVELAPMDEARRVKGLVGLALDAAGVRGFVDQARVVNLPERADGSYELRVDWRVRGFTYEGNAPQYRSELKTRPDIQEFRGRLQPVDPEAAHQMEADRLDYLVDATVKIYSDQVRVEA